MNRAERRRNCRTEAKADKTINIKTADVEKMKSEAAEQAVDTVFVLLLALPLIVLRDKHGFGKKRLEAFEEDLLTQYRCFSEGRISLEELRGIIRSETGMTVRTQI